jgi:hypothetical protein
MFQKYPINPYNHKYCQGGAGYVSAFVVRFLHYDPDSILSSGKTKAPASSSLFESMKARSAMTASTI